MGEPTAIAAHEEPGAAEYRALTAHCTTCQRCRTNTAVACPTAGRLRSAWSRARRTHRGGAQ